MRFSIDKTKKWHVEFVVFISSPFAPFQILLFVNVNWRTFFACFQYNFERTNFYEEVSKFRLEKITELGRNKDYVFEQKTPAGINLATKNPRTWNNPP